MFKFFGIFFLCSTLAALSVAEEVDTTTRTYLEAKKKSKRKYKKSN